VLVFSGTNATADNAPKCLMAFELPRGVGGVAVTDARFGTGTRCGIPIGVRQDAGACAGPPGVRSALVERRSWKCRASSSAPERLQHRRDTGSGTMADGAAITEQMALISAGRSTRFKLPT
jgi:hypothetical protein